jgi:hypothetical protein
MDCHEPHPAPNEKTQPIQWTERPTGALVAVNSLWPRPRFTCPQPGLSTESGGNVTRSSCDLLHTQPSPVTTILSRNRHRKRHFCYKPVPGYDDSVTNHRQHCRWPLSSCRVSTKEGKERRTDGQAVFKENKSLASRERTIFSRLLYDQASLNFCDRIFLFVSFPQLRGSQEVSFRRQKESS